MKLSYY